MKRPIIAVDIDDVLVSRAFPITDYLNSYFKTGFDLDAMEGESFFGFLSDCLQAKASRKQLSDLIEKYLVSDSYQSRQPTEGAVDSIKRLSESYDMVIISTRPKLQHATTEAWLQSHFGSIFRRVVLINEGHFGYNELQFSKTAYCLEHNISFIIDDKLSTCKEAADNSLEAILFGDYPWNKAKPSELSERVTRCKNWAAVLEYFDARG